MINHIISKCSKLVQKDKTRHDWVGKMIYWELCNLIILTNGICNTQNLSRKMRCTNFWDFKIQMDHLISARLPDPVIVDRIKLKESEKRDKYLDPARELKKLWYMKLTVIPIVIGTLSTVTKGLVQGLEDLEIKGEVDTIQATALLRLARILRRVLETWGDFLSLKILWESHQLMPVWKTLKRVKLWILSKVYLSKWFFGNYLSYIEEMQTLEKKSTSYLRSEIFNVIIQKKM